MGPSVRAILLLLIAAPAYAQAPVTYRVSFPAPEHHYAEVEVTFRDIPRGPLEVRMSRSSPGRYALHEFSKNVFDVHAFDEAGHELAATRPNPHQWDVAGHTGIVRIVYKVFGDRVDGTYLAIDSTHAHMNMPATLMWARGFDMRAIQIRFEPPKGTSWTPATQLVPTSDPWTFTAPNLQYLMDSPTELSAQSIRTFKVRNPDGKEFTIRAAIHHDATDAEVDQFAAGAQKIVNEAAAIFGEFPEFDAGTYTFLGDYVPWGGGDGMEHRNSTIVAAPISLRGNVDRAFGTVSHEFFHAWNVERIRPRSLEPFDFEEANMSGELWLAEGFTQYYGDLILVRCGLRAMDQTLRGMAAAANAVVNSPGRQFHSAVGMSEMAPFTDGVRWSDATNFSNTFISYYTYGAAIALGLDLTLRDRSNGRISLDDFMRAMWRAYGKPGGPDAGLVGKPYTLKDARDRLAEVSGDRTFADAFFDKYVEGRDVVDYARLFDRAGFLFRRRAPGAPWVGDITVEASGRVESLAPWGSPVFVAGIDQGDVMTSINGQSYGGSVSLQSVVRAQKPGDRIEVALKRRGGESAGATITVAEDPTYEIVPLESTGRSLTPEQRSFREGWLRSKGEKLNGMRNADSGMRVGC